MFLFARCKSNSGYLKPKGNVQKRDWGPQCSNLHLRKVSSLENSQNIRSRNLWGISFKYHGEVPQRQLFLSLSHTPEGETVQLQIPGSSSGFPYFSPQRILELQKGKMQRSRLWADIMPNSVVNPAFLVSYFMNFSHSFSLSSDLWKRGKCNQVNFMLSISYDLFLKYGL